MKGAELLAKQKFWIIGAILVVLLLLGIYWWGKRTGSSSKFGTLPEEIKGNEDATGTELDKGASLAERLYNDMKGANVMGHDGALWDEFCIADDRTITVTYNTFNQKYGGGETLYQWMDNESWLTGGLLMLEGFYTRRKVAMERLEALELT
jgi:hypothetical protein